MSFLIQCGYGPSDKIDNAISSGLAAGAILSPRHENPDRLKNRAVALLRNYPTATIMMDPQYYVATLLNPKDGKLPDYDYYAQNSGMNRTQFTNRRIHSIVSDCLDFQANLGVDFSYHISPTVLCDDFRDYWSQIVLSMAAEAMDQKKPDTDLLISLLIGEGALRSRDAVEDFADALTQLADATGFYLVLRRDSSSLTHSPEPEILANLMYLIYILSEINQYQVWVGYSDWCGFMLEAVGARGTAGGWFQKERQFSMSAFQPSAGGRQPRPRYSSLPLFANPLLFPELENVNRAGLLGRVLSGGQFDAGLVVRGIIDVDAWSRDIEARAHWHSLSSLSRAVDGYVSIDDRLSECSRLIHSSRNLHTQLSTVVNFERPTAPDHLVDWQSAIVLFRSFTGI